MNQSVIFRYITPIFNFNHFIDFEYDGIYKDASFSIKLQGYGDIGCTSSILPENDLSELFKYGTEGTMSNLYNMNYSAKFFPPYTSVLLVIDVVQPLLDNRSVSINTKESEKIFRSIVLALQLHATHGLAYEYTYIFRSPKIASNTTEDELPEFIKELAKKSPGCAVSRPNAIPMSFSPLGSGTSIVKEEQFSSCINTFLYLVEKEWDTDCTFDNVLQLAIDCHTTSFTLARTRHAFLMIMVAFEALFKKKEERKTVPASERIAKALSKVKIDFDLIKDSFSSGNQNNDFSKIRNDIAHGYPNAMHADLQDEYNKLFRYVSDAIIFVISENHHYSCNNYYDALDTYLNQRFNELEQQ